MKKTLFFLATLLAQPAYANGGFVQQVKDIFQSYTKVDATDWYNKGDTAFAEYTGINLGVYQHLKTSVRNNAVSIKMEYLSGGVRPDSEDFMNATTTVCMEVFRRIVSTQAELDKVTSWDDDTKDTLDFMDAKKLSDVYNETQHGVVNGWDIKIKRATMLTSCSVEKI
ncbi:TPA: hypothetical protein ACLHV0_003580 [Yersinia enterocolitica]